MRRLLPAVLVAVATAAAVVGAVQLYWHGRIFAGRLTFPLDLEWMEGGMLLHARRLAEGQSIYVPPSVDFIPYLYTPLYPAVIAGLSKIVPLGYTLGRSVSVAAFAGMLGLVLYAAGRQTAGAGRLARWTSLATGIAAAGTVAASFSLTGAFYDLVRSDSLLTLLEALALLLAFVGRGHATAALAGVAIALAFFTKQTAAILGVGIGLGMIFANLRRGAIYGITATAVLAVIGGVLYKTSGGWFWTYIYKLHQSHGFDRARAYGFTPRLLLANDGWLFAALAIATVGLALARRLRAADAIVWMGAVTGVFASCKGFGTQWAFSNAFIPAVFFPAIAAAVMGARLVSAALQTRKIPLMACAALALVALAAQSVRAGLPERSQFVPGAPDEATAARFIKRLGSLAGDGFIPFHPYYSVLVGKRPFTHRMGVMDVAGSLGRPAGLDQAFLDRRFGFVLLDWKSQPGEWPTLGMRYHMVEEIFDGQGAVRSFAGAETSPRQLWLPNRDAPAAPANGSRLFDFESGQWAGFTSEGDAFGAGPAPATAEFFGRFAADSRRFGSGPMGILRSPPFVLLHPHLRLSLAGDADPRLRVVLLDGADVPRSATPDAGARIVEWDVAELVGHTVILMLEDGSTAGGLALDEVVGF